MIAHYAAMAAIRAKANDRAGYREMIALAKDRANAASSQKAREMGWQWIIAALARSGDLDEARVSGHFDAGHLFLFPALMRAGDLDGAKRSLEAGWIPREACRAFAEAMVRAGRAREVLRWVRTVPHACNRVWANLGAAEGCLPPTGEPPTYDEFDDKPSDHCPSFESRIWRPRTTTSLPAR